MGYEIIKINNSTWSIEDDFVRFFLLKGKEKVLMIDTGIDIDGVIPLARAILNGPKEGGSWDEIEDGIKVVLEEAYVEQFKEADEKDLPMELINTHGDGDHCCGNREFEWFYMQEADTALYRSQFCRDGGQDVEIRFVNDGDILDLGDRPLKIIHIPGHTHGSIAILDVNNRALFAGDSVQDGEIFMFGGHRNILDYPASLMKLQEMDDEFDVVYASHADLMIDPEYIGELFDACESIFHGEVQPQEREVHEILVDAYDCGIATFLIDLGREFGTPDEE